MSATARPLLAAASGTAGARTAEPRSQELRTSAVCVVAGPPPNTAPPDPPRIS